MADEPDTTQKLSLDDTEYRAGRPFVFTNAEKLQAQIKDYFDLQDPHTEQKMKKTGENSKGEPMYGTREILTEQQPYTVTGLARHLGVSRDTLRNYTQYKHYTEVIDEPTRQALIRTIEDAFQRVEEFNEAGLHSPGKANGIKFNLVNNFKWQDRTISETTNPIDDLNALDDATDARDDIATQAAAALGATAQTIAEPEVSNDPAGPAPAQ